MGAITGWKRTVSGLKGAIWCHKPNQGPFLTGGRLPLAKVAALLFEGPPLLTKDAVTGRKDAVIGWRGPATGFNGTINGLRDAIANWRCIIYWSKRGETWLNLHPVFLRTQHSHPNHFVTHLLLYNFFVIRIRKFLKKESFI